MSIHNPQQISTPSQKRSRDDVSRSPPTTGKRTHLALQQIPIDLLYTDQHEKRDKYVLELLEETYNWDLDHVVLPLSDQQHADIFWVTISREWTARSLHPSWKPPDGPDQRERLSFYSKAMGVVGTSVLTDALNLAWEKRQFNQIRNAGT